VIQKPITFGMIRIILAPIRVQLHWVELNQSARTLLTLSAYLICTATCGSGATILTEVILLCESFVAAVGQRMLGCAGLLIVTPHMPAPVLVPIQKLKAM
jgi:hypothetical protein